MSTRLPVISGRVLVRALGQLGWRSIRTRGSHVRLEREGAHVTIPLHDSIKRGTLAAILADVGISADELRALL